MSIKNSPLGQNSDYISTYKPDLLFPIARSAQRKQLSIHGKLPFYGFDIWNAYELSWLNPKGKPIVAMAQFSIPCDSSHIIESKSLKLYLNSFNNTVFDNVEHVQEVIKNDLSNAIGKEVETIVYSPRHAPEKIDRHFNGISLDDLDITCESYHVNPLILKVENVIVSEVLYSDLLKSNCLVTGQPDWGSIQISYTGHKIQHHALLQYIISFRNHHEFHEHCVERIYMDIMQHCQPTTLTVHAKYLRRGGLDINPIRGSEPISSIHTQRLCRQ